MYDENDHLKPGTTLLRGQYTITGMLGNGGFGITYMATDSLDRTIVIKECYVDSLCRRDGNRVIAKRGTREMSFDSLRRYFVNEAKKISKMDHSNIVHVHDVFEENDTAYMSMTFVEGQDLESGRSLLDTPDKVVSFTRDMLMAIAHMHERKIRHRDISPDNILMSPGLVPVLIDFGAANEEVPENEKALSAPVVVKDGYSPQESYILGSKQTDASDLFSLAAVIHYVITGEPPIDPQRRMSDVAGGNPDPYAPLDGRISGYPKNFLAAIDVSLSLFSRDRIQSAHEWLNVLDQPKTFTRQGLSTSTEDKPQTPSDRLPTLKLGDRKRSSIFVGIAGLVLLIGAGTATVFSTGERGSETAIEEVAENVLETQVPTLEELMLSEDSVEKDAPEANATNAVSNAPVETSQSELISATTAELLDEIGISLTTSDDALIVNSVQEEALAGFQSGDVIRAEQITGHSIRDENDILLALQMLQERGSSTAVFVLSREGLPDFVTLRLDSLQ